MGAARFKFRGTGAPVSSTAGSRSSRVHSGCGPLDPIATPHSQTGEFPFGPREGASPSLCRRVSAAQRIGAGVDVNRLRATGTSVIGRVTHFWRKATTLGRRAVGCSAPDDVAALAVRSVLPQPTVAQGRKLCVHAKLRDPSSRDQLQRMR
jgi:hypothetical protein